MQSLENGFFFALKKQVFLPGNIKVLISLMDGKYVQVERLEMTITVTKSFLLHFFEKRWKNKYSKSLKAMSRKQEK